MKYNCCYLIIALYFNYFLTIRLLDFYVFNHGLLFFIGISKDIFSKSFLNLLLPNIYFSLLIIRLLDFYMYNLHGSLFFIRISKDIFSKSFLKPNKHLNHEIKFLLPHSCLMFQSPYNQIVCFLYDFFKGYLQINSVNPS